MKKVALVFLLAVLLPSLVLAWLAVRSLRDQQFLLERQQSLLDQRVTDTLAQNISDYLAQRQQEFAAQVEYLAATNDARALAGQFDDQIRRCWPLADVGFCVTTSGKILSPLPNARPDAQMFRLDNSGFLGNREPVEVYWNANSANKAEGQMELALNTVSPANPVKAPPVVEAREESSAGGSDIFSHSPSSFDRHELFQSALARNQASTGVAVPGASLPSQTGSNPSVPPEVPAAAMPTLGEPEAGLSGRPATPTASRFLNGTASGAVGGGGGTGAVGGEFAGDAAAARRVALAPADKPAAGPLADSLAPVAPAHPATPPAGELAVPVASSALPATQAFALDDGSAKKDVARQAPVPSTLNYKAAQNRAVSPQSSVYQFADRTRAPARSQLQNNMSKVIPAEAEFSQLIGDETDGMLARFLQNQLKLMFWHRLTREPDLIFGAQLNLSRVVDGLHHLVKPEPALQNEICLAVLDDNARPLVLSRPAFSANWKRPFVATEIGDALPHWEVAAYLVNPEQLMQAAHTVRLALGLLVAMLVLAIGVGGWLIVRSLNSELKLARQKTDFVSNVSHELKTPLTSIRMFSDLLVEGRVNEAGKQHSYLQIISAEAARLTRLINNVLDFSRMERGEKKYNFQPGDLAEIVRNTAETFRPHLESNGFKFDCELPETVISIWGDADALSQIIVNLLSNAEKYSSGGKEIALQLAQKQSPLPHAEVRVLDRGAGVPRGSEEKIFEKFYRAHDSLGSGIQGSGLGLTIARQIARAHGGDVVYEPRAGGGSCFILRLPVKPTETADESA